MKNTNKKGFTIVELVIVIAVIAILAAVLIPTFVGLVNKANVAADTALIKNLNTALAADTDGCKTMHEALEAAAEYGYDVAKINAKGSNNEILWDSKNNVFCYYNSESTKVEYIPDSVASDKKAEDEELWVIVNDASVVENSKYSVYAGPDFNVTEVTVNGVGFDAGKNETITIINYTGENETVIINSNGGIVNIDCTGTVYHYGSAAEVYVEEVADASYHAFGTIGYIEATKGRIVIENGAAVNAVISNSADNVEVEGADATVAHSEDDKAKIKAGAVLFFGGNGTAENPFLITNAEQMMNISKFYDTPNYYKVADGVSTIDGSEVGLGKIDLNGCFDGNGVTFTGINSQSLFANIKNDNGLCEVGNFTTGADSKFVVSSNGTSVVRSTESNAKLYDITVHGYIEGTGHLAGFVSYVYGEELTIENCYSDANLVCVGSEPTGGFVGHAFTAKIYVNNSEYAGNTYAKTNINRYLYVAQNNTGTVFVNGTQISDEAKKELYNADKCFNIAIINPVKGTDAYTFEKQTSGGVAVKAVVTIEVRSGYSDDNYGYPFLIWSDEMDLSNESGTISINHGIIDKIVLNADGVTETSFSDGVYNVYHSTFVTAPELPKINVTQYDANGNIVAVGTYNLDVELVLG